MRWALAQINTCMGNIPANQKKIAEYLTHVRNTGVTLTFFPELSLLGYPPRDDGLNRSTLEHLARAAAELAQDFSDVPFVVGSVRAGDTDQRHYNTAMFVSKGQQQTWHDKILLPNYDVFDEERYFVSGQQSRVHTVEGLRVGLSVCEDMWSVAAPTPHGPRAYTQHPLEQQIDAGLDILINLSASPFEVGKHEKREQVLRHWVRKAKVPFAFCNLVGGNDDLIFDGCSVVCSATGDIVARAKAFEEDFLIFDPKALEVTPRGGERLWPSQTPQWHEKALVLGLRDYLRKCGLKDVIVGLSGGIDSALVALLAVEALGPKHVSLVFMPSIYTREESGVAARAIALALQTRYDELSIEPLRHTFDHTLASMFQGLAPDVTEENIQARIRGTLLMALANKRGALVLTTTNKSEMAMGYGTLYGDMAGGLAILSDLYKHEVYALAQHMNQTYQAIPARVFERPPSAELKADQTDQDSLPPYDVLDAILFAYLEGGQSEAELLSSGFDAATVTRVLGLLRSSEFKRQQAPLGLKVSSKAFGQGRRMGIARGRR